MVKSEKKTAQINEMIDLFSRIIAAMTVIRDQDVSETEVLHDFGIDKNTFRRVVYDMTWQEKGTEGRGPFKDKVAGIIPTRNWAEELFCDVMGLSRDSTSCGKIPEDVTVTLEILINECLTDEEKELVKTLYKDCLTLEETAKIWDRSVERIRQKRENIFRKLRTRGHKAYLVYGDGYWYSQARLRDQVYNDLYVKKLKDELLRLDNLISYRKAVLQGIPAPIKDLKLEDMELSVRAYNCLYRGGVRTLGDILNHTPDELRRIKNLGYRCYEEVLENVHRRGFRLKEE
jgi:DNA-directed RNA polymerase, alpha subunit/40 kD subunit